jgi:hypothetical protein
MYQDQIMVPASKGTTRVARMNDCLRRKIPAINIRKITTPQMRRTNVMGQA